jgi:hypothetical protein
MFQPRVKLEFVNRYCAPQSGWCVCVDIDASEEGRTGGQRKTKESRIRQNAMNSDAHKVRNKLKTMRVQIGERKHWCDAHELPYFQGDPDVVAYDLSRRRCVIAEVEGASSGQPEQKLYKAVGQIIRTASNLSAHWTTHLVVVVYGDKIADHLKRFGALKKLDVSALALADHKKDDHWLFGSPPDA